MAKHWYAVAALTVSFAALTGCGSVARHDSARRQVTLPAYDAYPPNTISVVTTNPDSLACRRDARAFALASRSFVAHSGPDASYPADLYYLIMRQEIADFEARRCSPELLGAALERGLTATQRVTLVAELPSQMADVVRHHLSAAGS